MYREDRKHPRARRYFLNAGSFLVSIMIGVIIRSNSIVFPTSIDWDEDGFITIGKMLVFHGQLPFVGTYEHKPFLNYLLYGLPFLTGLTDPSIIRIFPIIILSIASVFLSLTLDRHFKVSGYLLISTLLIAVVSVLPTGLGWMTEINAVLAISISIFAITDRNDKKLSYFLIGFCFTLLPLTRTNLAIPALFIVLIVLKQERLTSKRLKDFALGALIPISITVIPYIFTNNIGALWRGMVKVHLDSIGQGDAFFLQFGFTHAVLVLTTFSFLFAGLILEKKSQPDNSGETRLTRRSYLRHLVFALGVFLSIFLDFPNYGHHLLQAAPSFVLVVLLLLRIVDWRLFQVTSLIIAVIVMTIYINSSQSRYPSSEAAVSSATSKCVNGIVSENTSAWLISNIYLYWQSKLEPVHPLVLHPTTLNLPAFLKAFPPKEIDSVQGVNIILQAKPKYIINDSRSNYLSPEVQNVLNSTLVKDYQLVPNCDIKFLEVYKRTSSGEITK